jgi:hypothetical protein
VSNKRVQGVLTYAELNDLLGLSFKPIETVVSDPVHRQVRIIFAGTSNDGFEPWTVSLPVRAVTSNSPPSTHTSDGSPTNVDAGDL